MRDPPYPVDKWSGEPNCPALIGAQDCTLGFTPLRICTGRVERCSGHSHRVGMGYTERQPTMVLSALSAQGPRWLEPRGSLGREGQLPLDPNCRTEPSSNTSMRNSKGLALGTGVALLAVCLVLFAGCNRRAGVRDQVLESIVKAYPCYSGLPELRRTPDSLTRGQSCALLAAAMTRLAEAKASDLPRPVSKSLVASATIDAMSERTFSESELGAWWVVTLELNDAPFNAEIRFDRRTGAARLRPVHK